MRTVNIPNNLTSLDELDVALKFKSDIYKYTLTEDEKVIIAEFYTKYDNLYGSADDNFKSDKLIEETNNALHNAYSEIQIAGRLKDLRSTLLLAVDKCPYCGILPADELDHYLPQSIYKAVSVYSRNLIPICHKCNNAKRIAVALAGNNSFFHAYFEVFPQLPVLIADIDFTDDILVINYKVDRTNTTNDLGNKLDFQFTRTKLNERLIKESNSHIFDNKAAIELMYESNNEDGVKKLFVKQYEEYKIKFGVNFWKTSLMLALSNCDHFCKGGFKNYFE